MRTAARKEELAAAVNAVRPRLEAAWADKSTPVAVRRRRLFGAWDECAEEGPEAVVTAAGLARKVIITFIRETIPADHPDAFTAEELEKLNKGRASKERFSPYD